MAEQPQFEVFLKHRERFQFEVRFDWENVAPIVMDEPKPLGDQQGANASRLLGAAVGNCLSASLLFCLQKAKLEVNRLETHVVGSLTRNEKGRLRVGRIEVTITLEVADEQQNRLSRCLSLFEDYCVVTGSVRQGIEVHVKIVDRQGNVLHSSES